MFTIRQKEGSIEINHHDLQYYALLNLHQGGRLEQFQIGNQPIIVEDPSFPYSDSYAAAILFPFVSRVSGGSYEFNGTHFQLHCNTPDGQNALHGLVYNKTFEFVSSDANDDECKVVLKLNQVEKQKGFPFTYQLLLTYTFSSSGIALSMKATNTCDEFFPFTIGWHPYFSIPNFENATLQFDADEQVVFDENLIATGTKPNPFSNPLQLGGNSFDDCFIVNDNEATLHTSIYDAKLKVDSNDFYLQMYTPPNLPMMAVEPMVGTSDSFNNKFGLMELAPQTSYKITWNIDVTLKENG